PLVMTVGLFGAIGGEPMILQNASGTLIGRIEAGSETWIQNAGFVWLFLLIPLAFAGWFGLNNLKVVTPDPGHPLAAFGKITGLYLIALFTAAVGIYAMAFIGMWLALPLTILLTLGLLRLLPGSIQRNIKNQFKIFSNTHTWSMTILYLLTFGSFIGFSAALPLSLSAIFGKLMAVGADCALSRIGNPDGPSRCTWSWTGPLVGASIRRVGAWISAEWGGPVVSQISSAVIVGASVVTGYVMMQAYPSTNPHESFMG